MSFSDARTMRLNGLAVHSLPGTAVSLNNETSSREGKQGLDLLLETRGDLQ